MYSNINLWLTFLLQNFRSEQAIKTRWHTTSNRQQEKNKQLSKAITRFNKHAAHEFLTSKGNKLHNERSVDGNGTDNSTIEFLVIQILF